MRERLFTLKIAQHEGIITPKADHIFYIQNEITDEKLGIIVKDIRNLERKEPNCTVRLEIDTPGGDVHPTMNLAQVMQNSTLKFMTVVTNRCYSSGVVIAAAGDMGMRFGYEKSDYFLHPIEFTLGKSKYTAEQLDNQLGGFDRQQMRYTELIANMAGISREKIQELINNENYFDANTARELGIIDHILISPKRQNPLLLSN